MKSRICLAWFGDFDSPERGRVAIRKATKKPSTSQASVARQDEPTGKEASKSLETRRILKGG